MTLILTLGNLDQVIQISDRRPSTQYGPEDEEQNKTGTLDTRDGRFAFAFTSLARIGDAHNIRFDTRKWLIAALPHCGRPSYDSYQVFEGLKVRATEDFQTVPALRGQRNKGLGIIFAGYLYRESPPRLAYAVLSNVAGVDGVARSDPARIFEVAYRLGHPVKPNFSFVKPFGFLPAMNPKDAVPLLSMLESRKPARAIIGKAVEMIRMFADRPEAQGTIGKQLCSITLSVDRSVAATSDYQSHTPNHTTYIPDFVVLKPGGVSAVTNISVTALDRTTPPIAGPKLGRNQPCFCGSGKKYKRCHGRPRAT